MVRSVRSSRFAARSLALAGLMVVLAGMRPLPPVDEAAAAYAEALAGIERALATNNPVTLDWKTMAALNYRTGEMPETLRRLNGVQVRIPGFMVPLEDWEQQVSEFILVPYFGACIHTPPPPPNQMAHVMLQRNRKVEVNLWDPVWITGTLKIESIESPYGVVGYQVAAERIQPYEG
jgi:uncharacterized protein